METVVPTYSSPPWPLHYQTGTVHATYLGFDGLPMSGAISFTPRAQVAAVRGDGVLVVAKTVTVNLDAGGHFSLDLPATDDPDVRPERFTYEVVESFEDANGRTYDIEVKSGFDLDLLDISPVGPSPGIVRYVGPPGPPGPSASGIVAALIFNRRF